MNQHPPGIRLRQSSAKPIRMESCHHGVLERTLGEDTAKLLPVSSMEKYWRSVDGKSHTRSLDVSSGDVEYEKSLPARKEQGRQIPLHRGSRQ